MSVSTLRTLTWVGLWWEEEVDFGNQHRAKPHIALFGQLAVCLGTHEGPGCPGGRAFWRCATIPKGLPS